MNKRLNLFLLFLLAMLAIPWSKVYAISDKTQLISNDCGFKVDTGRHEYIEFEIADVYPTFYGTRNWDHSRHIISIKSELIGYFKKDFTKDYRIH